jgi:pyrroline-5-carboxylate reductase
MRYGFIGLGNMATAILQGMYKSGLFSNDQLYGYDSIPEKTTAMQGAVGLLPVLSPEAVTRAADVILLAVKPQTLAAVLPLIKPHVSGNKLVITIAAGKTLDYYAGFLGNEVPIVRLMPNINAKVCAAASAICGNALATDAHRKIAADMFKTVGSVTAIDEKLFPAFSAIGGAAVAFAYVFIDALASAGVKAGMPKPMALSVATDTVLGSARLIKISGEHPRVLVDQVCSPGGTTIEGMHTLNRLGFESAVHQAIDAVIQKDNKIGES